MKNLNHLPFSLYCSWRKSILTIAFKVALNWRGPAPDWPLRSQCLAVLVWSPGMQQYARNDECRLFRFASKLVFFTTIIHIFWRQIFASLFNAEPGHLGATHSNQKKSSSHISEMQIWQAIFVAINAVLCLFIFLVQFQQFCCIFYVLMFMKSYRQ